MRFLANALIAIFMILAGPAAAQFADQQTWGGTAGGSANSLTISVPNYDNDYIGVQIRFLAASPNTSTTTVAINGRPAVPIYRQTSTGILQLTGGELVAGSVYSLIWDGAQYQLLEPPQGEIPIAATSPVTAIPAYCGKVISLGGNTFYPVTVGPATGFPLDCKMTFVNIDTARGKALSVDGYSVERLMPTLTLRVNRVAGSWSFDPGGNSQFWAAAPTFYWAVNAPGSDDPLISDCLINTSPCATFNKITQIAGRYLFVPRTSAVYTAQFNCDAQSFEHLGVVAGQTANAHAVGVTGNPSNPSACQLLSNTSGVINDVQDFAAAVFNGFLVGGTANCGFNSQKHAIIDLNNIWIGNITGSAVCADGYGNVNLTGPFTLHGNSNKTFQFTNLSLLYSNGQTINIPNGDNINVGTLLDFNANSVFQGGFVFGATSGVIGGLVFSCQLNSTLEGMSGTTFPGTMTPGTPGVSGCQTN